MAVSKRLRSEIFRRDNSTCHYCGAKAPNVEITIDHVIPVTLGGSDDPSNLVTACDPCNSGKTSVPPNAATVKQVSEDAFRWARAIEAAAENMVGQHETARAAFDKKWRAWGEGRPPVARPEDWGLSVDRFLKVGLPLPILLDCVDIAMRARHVKADDVFKYMCGVAWKEVAKLQDAAKASLGVVEEAFADEGEEESYLDPEHEDYDSDFDPRLSAGRQSLARELLSWFEGEEIDYFLDKEREAYREIYEEDPAEAVVDIRAGAASMTQSRWDIMHLADAVKDLLNVLPFEEIEEALEAAEEALTPSVRDKPAKLREAIHLSKVAEHILLKRTRALLAEMSVEAQTEWIAYGTAWHGPASPWDDSAELSEDKKIRSAAYVIRVIKSGRLFQNMCLGVGEHIERCPSRANYSALFEELDCCSPVEVADHLLHGFCARHLEFALENGLDTPGGRHLTIRDFKELDDA